MFQNSKYLTKGISIEVPFELQWLLWTMIEEQRSKIELDYLQVFKLNYINNHGEKLQEIIHTQEQPPYQNCIKVKLKNPLNNRTIFCIDDKTHSTMLFAEEY